ncbi:MAG TPA: amidohydrolase [Anaeromyxobacteraceae bacterium]|nr:amidohydrolase [Anaeromyxobacteraceae bacterium]
MSTARALLLAGASLLQASGPPAGAPAPATDLYLEETRGRWEEAARKIWGFHELALEERQSSALFADLLEKEGFAVQRGAAGMATAFVARAGSGKPVVAFLAEYDALPELSQVGGGTKKQPLQAGAPGHGCAHNLLGTAAVSAAVAANRTRVADRLPGTLVVFGTPAEEKILGKTFMARDGVFQGVDAVLAWHPGGENQIVNRARLAVSALDIEFFGKTAHAAANPWLGRSSLDAVELLDHAVALMREHVRPTARMHRVVKSGGSVPNIIADYAKVQWWVRDASGASVDDLVARVRLAAQGAATATETRVQVTVLAQTRDPIANDALGAVVQRELERVGAPRWDDGDQTQARAIQRELGIEVSGLSTTVVPYGPGHGHTASSDIGETSAVAPLVEFEVATAPAGSPFHHWAVTSCAVHPIGFKGMAVASKVLAASAVDLLRDPAAIRAAQEEFAKATGGQAYKSPLAPDARPAVY